MRGSVMKVNLAMMLLGLGLAAMPILAHHSVEEQYDTGNVMTIQGVVFKIVWVNPHSRLWVDTSNGVSTVSSWEMELPPPNALKIRNVSMDFVKEGDHVTVTLWRAKDGSRLGHALTLTTPDRKVMNFAECMRSRTCP